MNEAQRATLAKLLDWEVQHADSGPYIQIAYIFPDGRFVDATSGPATELVTVPNGTILIGKPD